MSWHFASGGQSFGAIASASVLAMNIQLICFRIDWRVLDYKEIKPVSISHHPHLAEN